MNSPQPWTACGLPPLSGWGGLPPGVGPGHGVSAGVWVGKCGANAAVGKPTGGKRWQATDSPRENDVGVPEAAHLTKLRARL